MQGGKQPSAFAKFCNKLLTTENLSLVALWLVWVGIVWYVQLAAKESVPFDPFEILQVLTHMPHCLCLAILPRTGCDERRIMVEAPHSVSPCSVESTMPPDSISMTLWPLVRRGSVQKSFKSVLLAGQPRCNRERGSQGVPPAFLAVPPR